MSKNLATHCDGKGLVDTVREVVERNADLYVSWLVEACSIPTVADEPEAHARMIEWLEAKFADLGATTERLTYEGAPDALLARLGEGDRTVLIYDHYDVQPVDPIELWNSKPFEPEIRDGKLFARGCADNKGDLVARLAGLHAHLEVHGSLPVAVKFLIEGEEETGSKSFDEMSKRYAEKLAADGCIWEGHGVDHQGRPEFVFGAKGLCYIELNLRGLADDQHSSLAVVAPSPVWRMLEALNTLRAPDGSVLIDGFYDDVVEPTADDLAMLETLPFDEDAELERLGIGSFVGGVSGLDLLKRYFFYPTCNIAGIVSGFTVPNTSKTVLPKEIMVKLDLRLVPDQDPDDIFAKVRAHLDARGFTDIDLKHYSMEHPVRSSGDTPLARATVEAAREVFDQPPAIAPMMIGTGPMWPVASPERLGIPTVSPAGVCRPDSNIHAPNENVRIDDYLRVVDYTSAYLTRFAEID